MASKTESAALRGALWAVDRQGVHAVKQNEVNLYYGLYA